MPTHLSVDAVFNDKSCSFLPSRVGGEMPFLKGNLCSAFR